MTPKEDQASVYLSRLWSPWRAIINPLSMPHVRAEGDRREHRMNPLRARKRETCDSCRRKSVTKRNSYCYGCHRLVCVRCALTKGHLEGGGHR